MVLRKIRNQRGAGSIGCLFMAACIGAAMYAGFQFGLPRATSTALSRTG